VEEVQEQHPPGHKPTSFVVHLGGKGDVDESPGNDARAPVVEEFGVERLEKASETGRKQALRLCTADSGTLLEA
jgi:hypothetical protein